MSQDEFTKLFKYITERFDKLESIVENKADKKDVQMVLDSLDELNKKQEITDDERLVMGHQLDRLDRWVHELAKQINYKLST